MRAWDFLYFEILFLRKSSLKFELSFSILKELNFWKK